MSELQPCRACEHQVSRDAVLCPNCGARQPWRAYDPSPRGEPVSVSRLAAGVFLGGVGILVFIWVLYFFFGNGAVPWS